MKKVDGKEEGLEPFWTIFYEDTNKEPLFLIYPLD